MYIIIIIGFISGNKAHKNSRTIKQKKRQTDRHTQKGNNVKLYL